MPKHPIVYFEIRCHNGPQTHHHIALALVASVLFAVVFNKKVWLGGAARQTDSIIRK